MIGKDLSKYIRCLYYLLRNIYRIFFIFIWKRIFIKMYYFILFVVFWGVFLCLNNYFMWKD